MTRSTLVLLAAIFLITSTARAQQVLPPFGPPTGIACAYNTSLPSLSNLNAGWVQCDANGRLLFNSSGGGGGTPTGTPTQVSVSVTTSSTTALAASTATTFIKLCLAVGAANSIWVNWSGAAATTAPPSENIVAGQCDSWAAATGFLPTSAITVIATGAVTATLEYK